MFTRLPIALSTALFFSSVGPASAYTYESRFSAGCHERITVHALRSVRGTFATAAPFASTSRDDRALVDDLPYALASDVADLDGATLTIGVRDNDLHGNGPAEVDQLALVHGNPTAQREHCLRAPDEDEPDGTRAGLERCKAFIRENVARALDGLDARGYPDPSKRSAVDVELSLRRGVTAQLPTFWVGMGRAIHTLQDSFTHTYRSPDRMRVRVLMNWSDEVEGTRTESRDGPAHRGELDACDDLDDLREKNLSVATEATLDLLRATLDPALTTREAKLAAVETTLTKYLSYEPGCTEANGWCDAPERQYAVAAQGCSVGRSRTASYMLAALCLSALLLLLLRRVRRATGLPSAVGCVLALSTARAEAAEPAAKATAEPAAKATTGDASAPAMKEAPEKPSPGSEPPTVATPPPPSEEEQKRAKEHQHPDARFGLYAAGSGSITDPSLSGQLGLRVRVSPRITVGLDGELNGWFGFHSGTLRVGAFNGYATAILRTPLRYANFNIRSTAALGVSVMMLDLYGAPRGSVGPFFGLTPLGVEWKLSSSLLLVIDAIGVAVPVPQVSGAPFAYPQYRTAIGVEVSL